MHASIEQLLNLRDGRGTDAALVGHVAGCERCQGELGRLRLIQAGLQALGPLQAPAGSWEAIRNRRKAVPAASVSRTWNWVAALAATVAVTVVVLGLLEQVPGRGTDLQDQTARVAAVDDGTGARETAAPELDTLQQRSRELEWILRAMPEGPRVVRADTAGTIAELEDRVALVDYRLSLAAEQELTPEQSRRLWRERVDLMDSLVKVRYAQVQQVSF